MAPNIIQLQREVESLSDERLLQEAQSPDMFPPFLSLQELQRRKQSRSATQAAIAQQPTNTVQERMVEEAALSGIGSIPQQVDPQQAMMQMPPEMMQQGMMQQGMMPAGMANGGLVGYQDGGEVGPDDPWYKKASDAMGYDGNPGRAIGDAATAAAIMYLTKGKVKNGSRGLLRALQGTRPQTLNTARARAAGKGAGIGLGIGQLFQGRGWFERDPYTIDEDSMDKTPGFEGSVGQDVWGMPGIDNSGIDSLLRPLPPRERREELDISQYFGSTPEEQAMLAAARSQAESLEARIDRESDKVSSQTIIMSNVARALARGQVPHLIGPVREHQDEQRERNEGLMDASQDLQMAALSQEAGLSRSQQEAMMQQAIGIDNRDRQEEMDADRRDRIRRGYQMSQSQDPEVAAQGAALLMSVGVNNPQARGSELTGGQRVGLNEAVQEVVVRWMEKITKDRDSLVASTDGAINEMGMLLDGTGIDDQDIQEMADRVASSMNAAYISQGGS